MATKQAREKILRVGIIQNGRIIEERLLRNREPVSVGQKLNNTFVIASNAFPPSYSMFDVKGGKYQLNFTDKMKGRILLAKSVHDLNSLQKNSKAKATSTGWSLELSQRARGKVTLGDVTILFQFVNPPPLRVLPQLPANMRGSLLLFLASIMGLSGGFLASMVFSTVSQVGGVLWLVLMVPPSPRSVGIEALPDRFVSIIAPQEEEEDPELDPSDMEVSDDGIETEVEEEETESEPAEEEEPSGEEEVATEDNRTRDEIREEARDVVRQESALAAFYGGGDTADGPTLGFTEALTDRRADEVLANQTALGENAGSGGIVSRSGLGTSSGAEGEVGRARVGGGGGSEVAAAATTERTEERDTVQVRASVRGRDAQTRGGTVDQDSLQRTLRRKRADIERCYERALAGDPELAGRILIEFTIGSDGRVSSASLRENSVGSAVGSCIEGRVRRWRFDPPEGGNATVRVPYILEPSS
jgi:TonB family protein